MQFFINFLNVSFTKWEIITRNRLWDIIAGIQNAIMSLWEGYVTAIQRRQFQGWRTSIVDVDRLEDKRHEKPTVVV